MDTSQCRHCGRRVIKEDGGLWVDPEATGDDSMWRETCDAHDTFNAYHEPSPNPTEQFPVLHDIDYSTGEATGTVHPFCSTVCFDAYVGQDRDADDGDYTPADDFGVPEDFGFLPKCEQCGDFVLDESPPNANTVLALVEAGWNGEPVDERVARRVTCTGNTGIGEFFVEFDGRVRLYFAVVAEEAVDTAPERV